MSYCIEEGLGFRIGDEVESLVDYNEDNPNINIGSRGVVVCIKSDFDERFCPIGVDWYKTIQGGHGCYYRTQTGEWKNHARTGHGWFVKSESICVVSQSDVATDDLPDVCSLFEVSV